MDGVDAWKNTDKFADLLLMTVRKMVKIILFLILKL